MQESDIQSKNNRIKGSKLKEMRLLKKWRQSIGVYNCFGSLKPIVTKNDLNNYFELS